MKYLLSFLLIIPFLGFAQSVKGTFSPADDFTYAFLYKANPNGADYVNRGQLNNEGTFEIQLDSTVKPGIYKIVYAVPPEENNFDFIYDGKESVAFNFSYDNGVKFTASEENKLWNSYLKSMNMVNQTISNYYSKKNIDKAGFKAIFKVATDTQNAYEESAKDKLVYAFIKANRPYIPEAYENLNTYSKHLKAHFFNQIDFSNNLLQSSSFLVDRITAYVFNMVENPSNETYKSHIDDVASAIGNTDLEIKTILLEILWQRFVAMENHEVANYIADKHLLDLAKTTDNKVLSEILTAYKKTSIGTKAPNFEMNVDGEKTTLHDFGNTQNYLLIFWSSGCSHCIEELPKVKALVAKRPNLKVIAFALEDTKSTWENTIKSFPAFVHVLGLGKWDNTVVKTYGITATPTYFLLDKDKTIIAKPYAYEDLEKTIEKL